MFYRFSDFALDTERNELHRRGGESQELQPKVSGVLEVLLRARGQMVTKAQLLDAVWPDVVITEGSLVRAISLARQALGDRYGDDGIISTVWGRGYRISVAVEVSVYEAPIPEVVESPSYRVRLSAVMAEAGADLEEVQRKRRARNAWSMLASVAASDG
jgi:DNA-binding winged helix-turn-helix (wHTH) protein